jgi:2,5-dioxopentanoate dehydrogenase
MTFHGKNFIGSRLSASGSEIIYPYNAVTGEALSDGFAAASDAEVDEAVTLADSAFHAYRALSPGQRASFLEAIAEEIEALGDALLERAALETALPAARLTGERGRTTGQLRMFAGVLREGSWVEARIELAMPDRKPLPRADLRRMLIPLGPVAVFGASNFPFAFSVAGGDTASALAAGCPVIVKAHPAHPGTSELTATAVLKAAERTGMPEGVFCMLHGTRDTGIALINHPLLQAAGFTGSLTAGRALFNAAAARPRPIPVYAEMGSVNPVFILPGALAERGDAIAAGLATSITVGVGQFCTNPGLSMGIQSDTLETFVKNLAAGVSSAAPGTMLHPGISKSYRAGVERIQGTAGVDTAGISADAEAANPQQAAPVLFSTTAQTFLADHTLSEENFGPSSILVAAGTPEELIALAHNLEGQLTATVHGTSEDFEAFAGLISVLETRCGRLVFNGFPTGVEVGTAMQHGGPYPSTTDSRSTSVGTAAIDRFVRPVCYQDMPASLLPPALQNANPLGILRMVNGEYTREPIS